MNILLAGERHFVPFVRWKMVKKNTLMRSKIKFVFVVRSKTRKTSTTKSL